MNVSILFIWYAGTFIRIVDAVKGPFFPSPPPLPSYMLTATDPAFPSQPLFATTYESDPGIIKEPDDPY
jgi:hypothetical protein